MAVTPVRTGPSPTFNFPLPEMSVVCPTSTPLTSVMALFGPGVPSKGTPRSRARGLAWAKVRVLALTRAQRSTVRNRKVGDRIIRVGRSFDRWFERRRQYKAWQRWFRILLGKESGDDMENWKRAVIAGSAGVAAMLLLKGKRPAAVLVGGVGLVVLASEYPNQFVRIREELPSYVRQGTKFLDLAMKIGSRIEELAEKRA